MSITIIPCLAVVMGIIAFAWGLCALVLVLVILIQKGKGGGLSGAFGAGLPSGILGSKAGDFLTWFTIMLAGIFIVFSVVLAKYYRPSISDFDAEVEVRQVETAQPDEKTETLQQDAEPDTEQDF